MNRYNNTMSQAEKDLVDISSGVMATFLTVTLEKILTNDEYLWKESISKFLQDDYLELLTIKMVNRKK